MITESEIFAGVTVVGAVVIARSLVLSSQLRAAIKDLEAQRKRGADLAQQKSTLEVRLASLERIVSDQAMVKAQIEEAKQSLEFMRAENARQLAQLKQEHDQALEAARMELDVLNQAIAVADQTLDAREGQLYPRMYADESSSQLHARMAEIEASQAEIRRKGQVVINFGASRQAHMSAEDRVQTKSLVRLARLALEGACDVLLAKIRATNVSQLDERFNAIVTDLNRTLKPWEFAIGKNYQNTVHAALALRAEYLQQVDKEREEQRALREQMREEAAAQREAEHAQRAAEIEEARARKELERAQQAAAHATDAERARWTAKVAELEAALSTAQTQTQRAVAMAQLTKRGHVYVISNIGSFGDDVFKVGMTRRLDPHDRVTELGDASVPFPFDIHGLIKSDDCPALEGRLHIALEAHRINLVNERKEFFRIKFVDLRQILLSVGCAVEYTEAAEALQFRQSQVLRDGRARPMAQTLAQAVAEVGAEEDGDDAGDHGG